MNRAEERNYRLNRLLLGLLLETSMDLSLKGEENIPQEGAVLVSNHRSDLDPLILSLRIEQPINWMAGKYLYNIPLVREILSNAGTIPISRELKEKAYAKAAQALKKNQLVGIFPEGWDYIADNIFNKPVGKFHPGFAQIALQNNALVIPTAIIEIEAEKEKTFFTPKLRKSLGYPEKLKEAPLRLVYKKAKIKIGRPIKLKREQGLEEICKRVRSEVIKLLR